MSEPKHPPFPRYQLAELAAPGSDTFVDGPFGSSLKSHEYVDAGVRLIQLQNIGEGEWRDQNKKFITPRKFKTLERHGAVPGDIAIAKMADPVARACLVPPVSEQFVVVADCIRLRLDKSRFDAGYVVRTINSPYTRREAEKKAIGSTRVRINLSVLKTVGCLAPTLPEQQEITRILDTLDTAIHETEAIITKLKAVKQGLLHDLLTRGIDANGELRPRQAEAPHLYKDSPLGWIPKEWDVSTAGAEFAIDSGITLGAHRVPRHRPKKYLRVANVHRARLVLDDIAELEASDAEAVSRALDVGDLLVVEGHASTNEIGRCAMVDESVRGLLFQNHLFRLRSKHLLPAFALLWLNSAHAKKYWRCEASTSSGLNTINRTKLGRLLVAVPAHEEQKVIAGREASVTARIKDELRSLEKCQALKAALMDDLLTGRVRVTPLLEAAAP